jgi:hypothetical protein
MQFKQGQILKLLQRKSWYHMSKELYAKYANSPMNLINTSLEIDFMPNNYVPGEKFEFLSKESTIDNTFFVRSLKHRDRYIPLSFFGDDSVCLFALDTIAYLKSLKRRKK